jgi:hypothetical protein
MAIEFAHLGFSELFSLDLGSTIMLIARQKGAGCRRFATACPSWCEKRLDVSSHATLFMSL